MSPPARPHRLVRVVAVLMVAPVLAGCAGMDGSPGEPATLYESFEAARDADGTLLEPLDPDRSSLRARLLAPAGFQTLATGDAEFVVLLFDPLDQEPALDATVSVETQTGESTRLEEDAHGVYAGNVAFAGSGKRPARIHTILGDGRGLTFPIEVAAWSDASDARSADGLEFAPVSGPESVRLKLLSPDEPLRTEAGIMPFTFLLYDGATGEPIAGADAELASWMPPHGLPEGGRMEGHGTHSEVDPVRHRTGLYQGQVHPVMNGTWWTNVTVALEDGSRAAFRVTFDVGTGSHSHGDTEGHEGHAHSHAFSSFRDALRADGKPLRMTSPDGTQTLTAKLLIPDADAASTGEQEVKILLHRSEAGRPAPVPLGRVELGIHKHTHDGGVVDANTSEIVHSGHGIWTAKTNLTEEGTWAVHVDVQTPDGTLFGDRWQVDVGQSSDAGHDHHDHDHG